MASLVTRNNGHREVRFTLRGQRKTIRLGKCTQRKGERDRRHIASMVAALEDDLPFELRTSAWLDQISQKLYDKLGEAGLVRRREDLETSRLDGFVEYCKRRKQHCKPSTLKVHDKTYRTLLSYFKPHREIADITPGDADEYREWLRVHGNMRTPGKPLSDATVTKRILQAREFFELAVRKKWIHENPFSHQKHFTHDNPDRNYEVTRTEIDQLLEVLPTTEWRLILLLARYGGLRVPSELLALKWEGVLWDKRKIWVESPKNARFLHKRRRLIPIFPEFAEALDEHWQNAPEGEAHVIYETRRDNTSAYRARFRHFCKLAGLDPWPKFFQNMRATRETELMAEHPIHVVCYWLNNSPRTGQRHYLRVHEGDYERALSHNTSLESPPVASRDVR